jgi:HAD superfamily hydrolase (TIGR01509 family)
VGDFAAVLWDLDGTLIDSEPLWMAGEHDLAEAHGAVWTQEDGLALVGNTLIDSGHYIKQRLGSELAPEAIVDILVARLALDLQREIPWRPGARELVLALDDRATLQALVTMSYEPIAAPVAAALPFRAVVTGDRVINGKPHPECYLRAAEHLGVDAADCLAIEDSVTGAAAANAAGCRVLVVPHFVNVPDAPRRVQRASLEGLLPDGLLDLF